MRSPVSEAASGARFSRLKKKLTRLNPEIDIESALDPTLTHSENIHLVRERYPNVRTTDHSEDESAEQESSFRSNLEEQYSISNRKVQDMVAEVHPSLSTDESNTLSYLVGGGRSLRAVAIDKAKQARKPDDIRDWIANFNRADIHTLDNKPKGYVPKYKLKRENRAEWQRRVNEDKQRYSETGAL